MSEPLAEPKPPRRRSRVFLAILLVLLVGGGGAVFVVYKQIWDADRPTAPLPGRATGLTKADPADADAQAVTQSQDKIEEFFNGFSTALAYTRDGMRTRFAVETLKTLGGQVDGVKETIEKLPPAEKTKAIAAIKEKLAAAKGEAEKTYEVPGLGAQLKPIVEPIFAKLEALAK